MMLESHSEVKSCLILSAISISQQKNLSNFYFVSMITIFVVNLLVAALFYLYSLNVLILLFA